MTTASIEKFSGFLPEAFEVYEVPDFALRMPLLKQKITPGLTLIGEELRENMSELLGETVFPHVAKHLRRTVNPPEETWVAFAREKRAYKPFVHPRIAVNRNNLRVLIFVEDYAEDKLLFADNLEKNARKLAGHFHSHPEIQAYDVLNAKGEPLSGSKIKTEHLKAFAARMRAVKGQHARFGIPFPKHLALMRDGEELLKAVENAITILRPLYDCGKQAPQAKNKRN